MAVFKCKICGGSLDITDGVSVATCEYCGTKQTVTKSRNEVVTNLFNRASNLRLKCEFDKAEQVYEKILDIDNTDSEAHWGIVLCKYGIEYVEDSKTYSRIPTCHRTLYEAVLTDVDYLAAIENADEEQRALYVAEAKIIDQLQKNILNIVNSEEPFDIFICYKEADENGERTVDSTIANDIYYQLNREGFKVFYAPITLEDKLGYEYEPYIFAALTSAKVMLIVGTKPEYFDSVWVKNEWSRFIKLAKTDRSKMIIPCYKDMDAYDLPDEFAHLQAQDMGKIGFINDLIRGIKKVENNDITSITPQKDNVSNVAAMLDNAFAYLEANEWKKAGCIFEEVLKTNPRSSEAYLGKCMVDFHVDNKKIIKTKGKAVLKNKNFKTALKFATGTMKCDLQNIVDTIQEKLQQKKAKFKKSIKIATKICLAVMILLVCVFLLVFGYNKVIVPKKQYDKAVNLLNNGSFDEAIVLFDALGDYRDSYELSTEANYQNTLLYIQQKDYIKAYNLLDSAKLKEYKDCAKYKEEIYLKYRFQLIKSTEVGELLYIDNNLCSWHVVAKDGEKVLLLCTGSVTMKQINEYNATNWKNSKIRSYLNKEFYNMQVPSYLYPYILETDTTYDKSLGVTYDKIFIPSSSEYQKYEAVLHSYVNSDTILRDINSKGYLNYRNYTGYTRFERIKYTFNIDVEDNTYSAYEARLYNRIIENSYFYPIMWVNTSNME